MRKVLYGMYRDHDTETLIEWEQRIGIVNRRRLAPVGSLSEFVVSSLQKLTSRIRAGSLCKEKIFSLNLEVQTWANLFSAQGRAHLPRSLTLMKTICFGSASVRVFDERFSSTLDGIPLQRCVQSTAAFTIRRQSISSSYMGTPL